MTGRRDEIDANKKARAKGAYWLIEESLLSAQSLRLTESPGPQCRRAITIVDDIGVGEESCD